MTGFTYSIINKEPKHHWRWKTSFPRRSRGFPLLGETGGGGKITEGHHRLPGSRTHPGRLPHILLSQTSPKAAPILAALPSPGSKQTNPPHQHHSKSSMSCSTSAGGGFGCEEHMLFLLLLPRPPPFFF